MHVSTSSVPPQLTRTTHDSLGVRVVISRVPKHAIAPVSPAKSPVAEMTFPCVSCRTVVSVNHSSSRATGAVSVPRPKSRVKIACTVSRPPGTGAQVPPSVTHLSPLPSRPPPGDPMSNDTKKPGHVAEPTPNPTFWIVKTITVGLPSAARAAPVVTASAHASPTTTQRTFLHIGISFRLESAPESVTRAAKRPLKTDGLHHRRDRFPRKRRAREELERPAQQPAEVS